MSRCLCWKHSSPFWHKSYVPSFLLAASLQVLWISPTLATRPTVPSVEILADLLGSLRDLLRSIFSRKGSRTKGPLGIVCELLASESWALVCLLSGGAALIGCRPKRFCGSKGTDLQNSLQAQVLLAGANIFYVPLLSLVFNRGDHRFIAAIVECLSFFCAHSLVHVDTRQFHVESSHRIRRASSHAFDWRWPCSDVVSRHDADTSRDRQDRKRCVAAFAGSPCIF